MGTPEEVPVTWRPHKRALLLAAGVAAAALMAAAKAQPSGVRGACKIFIERAGQPGSDADFGDFSDWTVVDNRDGTWSVGARYIGYAPGRARGGRYTTCILRKTDNGFTLVKLSHLR